MTCDRRIYHYYYILARLCVAVLLRRSLFETFIFSIDWCRISALLFFSLFTLGCLHWSQFIYLYCSVRQTQCTYRTTSSSSWQVTYSRGKSSFFNTGPFFNKSVKIDVASVITVWHMNFLVQPALASTPCLLGYAYKKLNPCGLSWGSAARVIKFMCWNRICSQ